MKAALASLASLVLSTSMSMSIVAVAAPAVAQTHEPTLEATKYEDVSCDRRSPIVEVTLEKQYLKVGYGYPDSDTIIWLDSNVPAGTHRYVLPRQGFGAANEQKWVMVAQEKTRDGVHNDVSESLTFRRPPRSSCVVTQNIRIGKYTSDVNQTCGENQQKVFAVKAFVPEDAAGYFAGKAFSEIVLRNDRQLNANGAIVPPSQLEVDFWFFPKNPAAGVKRSSAENSLTVVTSSDFDVTITALDSYCIEKGERKRK